MGNNTTRASDLSLIQASLGALGEAAYLWDIETDEIRWFGDVRHLLGQDPDHKTIKKSRDLNLFINPQDLPERIQAINNHRVLADRGKTGVVFDTEYRLRLANGEQQWVHERAQFISSDHGLYMCATIRFIEERQSDYHSLERLAFYDELTGHHNRTGLQLTMDAAIESAIHNKKEGGFLAVGIDRLSFINEAFGSSSADAVITGVGNRLQRCMGDNATIGRISGDVFGILLPDIPGFMLNSLSSRIIKEITGKPFSCPSGPQRVSVSIGGAAFPTDSKYTLDIITKAESAMQESKENGRGCFTPYRVKETTRDSYRNWLRIGDEFLLAAETERLIMAFQPVIDARNDSVFFHECLLRMIDPNGDVIEAGKFIPALEQLGLTRLVDQFTVKRAIDELSRFDELCLSVNISAQTINDSNWLRKLVALLRDKADVANRLIIEITENFAMSNIEHSARLVQTLHDLGCRVALDDFGVGQTSFAHLRLLGVDIIKIDKSFIQNIGNNEDNLRFVRALKSLADGYNLETVCEGAETLKERMQLQEDGLNYIQGYVHGLPTVERLWLDDNNHTQRMLDTLKVQRA